jgi:hypothetical protein
MQVGEPIREGWETYKRFWQHLLPIALVVYVLISLVTLLFAAIGGILGALVAGVVSIAGVFLLQGALVEAVADVRDGRADLGLMETIKRVLPRLGPIALASVVAAIAVVIGFILLIVPGLFLLTIWSLIVPAIVLEGAGAFESFGRSRELVRGHGWTVFGVIVVTVVIAAVVSGILAAILSGLPDELGTYISNVIGNTLTAPFIAAVWTSMYFRLKQQDSAPVAVEPGAAYTDA